MHKYELLRLRAEQLRTVLEEYAKKDEDVAWFLERWMPLYEKIMRREVSLPCYDYQLDKYFVNPDLSKMAETYHYKNSNHPLNMASGAFSCAIRDRYSDPQFVASLREKGELLDLIPDEPPPLDEEAPLPVVNESLVRQARENWLYRWIFGKRTK